MAPRRGAVAAPGHKTKYTKREIRDALVEEGIKRAKEELSQINRNGRPMFLPVNSKGKLHTDNGPMSARSQTLRALMYEGYWAVDVRTGRVFQDIESLRDA